MADNVIYGLDRVFLQGPDEFINHGTPSALVIGGAAIVAPRVFPFGGTMGNFLTTFGFGYIIGSVLYEAATMQLHEHKTKKIKRGLGHHSKEPGFLTHVFDK